MAKTVTNQKRVKININVSFPEEGKNAKSEEIYGKINKESAFKAVKTLTPSAFAIYMYMALQENSWEFGLSPAAIADKIGVKRTAYHSAVKELIDNNYLIELKGNLYAFIVDNGEEKVSKIKEVVSKREALDENPSVEEKETEYCLFIPEGYDPALWED